MTAPDPDAVPGTKKVSTTRMIVDLGPAVTFFVAFQIFNRGDPETAIINATMVFVPVAALAFVYGWLKERMVSPIALLTFALILVTSGLTIWLDDPSFVKMRPTIIYGVMALLLLGSVALNRNVLKTMMGFVLELSDARWRTMAIRAGVFYVVLAVINELVWRTQPTDVWVTYNTFGDVALSMLFWGSQLFLAVNEASKADGTPVAAAEGTRPEDGRGPPQTQ
jgi:intracellular septation protein